LHPLLQVPQLLLRVPQLLLLLLLQPPIVCPVEPT
jgi:hypothetical protein